MPDTGNLHVEFVANLNTIQVPVSLISSGAWSITSSDSVLVMDNDSVSYSFEMVSGLPTRTSVENVFHANPCRQQLLGGH
jgi:hypothetical protein